MAASIPLHCNICPKKPNFSDVSHLLTHIASKGHLSHYYKIKVRSSNEDASRRLIEAYDQWYAEWNVEELMSERMSQKDKRRTRARPTARAAPAPKIEAPRPARPRAAVGTLLDPRLAEQQQLIKAEGSTPITSTPTPQPGPVLRQRNLAPHMQYWTTGSRASSRSYTNPDYETSSEYSDPSERRRYRYTIEDSCAIEDEPADATMEDPVTVSECTKLKGIYWPGMDIFDSATPEMRRKRNQKKDSSVVEQLELNSQEVEPTELIFTPQGSFKRQRRISSSDDDDEEDGAIKAESPRKSLIRPVLADMDINAARRPRPTSRPSLFGSLNRSQYDEDRGRADYSYEYGYGDRAPRKKRGFDVFQEEGVSFNHPASFNYLTAGFNPQRSPTPALGVSSYKPLNDSFQYENKENIPPALLQSAYENHHHHHATGYHYHAYAYGLGDAQHTFQYNNHLYASAAFQQQNHDDDDQRTITAPPSPSTS